MTDDMHSCSYYCDRPACIKAQRDELVRKYVEVPTAERVRVPDAKVVPYGSLSGEKDYAYGYEKGYADGFNACRDLVLSAVPEVDHDHP